uniref:Uncharacterized protein n=1 Tax=Setaria viridis TaxID=4556 RepID=A0A4U6TMV1_SETVI|nr:hypothetical protein SEVIR_8G235900v2 [Setaria viridis]
MPVELEWRCPRPEVAKPAVKASLALVKAAAEAAATQPSSTRRCCRCGAVAPLVFLVPEEYVAADPVSPISQQVAAAQKRRVACRGGRAATRFSLDLTAIPESE